MIWWTLLAGLVVGVVLLVLFCLPVLRRLHGLREAMAGLQANAAKGEDLRVRLEELNADVQRVNGRVAAVAAERASGK